MAQLKCTNKAVAGEMFSFPLIGKVTFDKDKVIDVKDSIVDDFLKIQCGFTFEEVSSKKKFGELAQLPEEGSEKEAYLVALNALSKEELSALLSTHPGEETKKLKSNIAKIDYLLKKQFV